MYDICIVHAGNDPWVSARVTALAPKLTAKGISYRTQDVEENMQVPAEKVVLFFGDCTQVLVSLLYYVRAGKHTIRIGNKAFHGNMDVRIRHALEQFPDMTFAATTEEAFKHGQYPGYRGSAVSGDLIVDYVHMRVGKEDPLVSYNGPVLCVFKEIFVREDRFPGDTVYLPWDRPREILEHLGDCKFVVTDVSDVADMASTHNKRTILINQNVPVHTFLLRANLVVIPQESQFDQVVNSFNVRPRVDTTMPFLIGDGNCAFRIADYIKRKLKDA